MRFNSEQIDQGCGVSVERPDWFVLLYVDSVGVDCVAVVVVPDFVRKLQ